MKTCVIILRRDKNYSVVWILIIWTKLVSSITLPVQWNIDVE
jgi:hypothetical protein